jgi:hypothetical protein
MHRFFRFSFFDSADHWRGDFPAHVTDSIKAPAVPVFVSSLRDLTFSSNQSLIVPILIGLSSVGSFRICEPRARGALGLPT